MKRLIIFIGLSLSCLCGVNAQQMAELFTIMPDTYIPQLENAWRKDLVDLYKSDKAAKLKNMMEGTSELKKLTEDYLLLQLTERSTVEMKRLPLINDSYIICMITTVYGPVPDSRVRFFTTEWKLLDLSDFLEIVPADWFIREDVDRTNVSFVEAEAMLDMDLRKYSLNETDQTLTIEYTTPLYLSQTDRKRVMPFLKKDPKVYTWKKVRFE